MADNNTIARPYAEAAFEVASDAGMLAEWADALAVAGDMLADGQVATFLANPSLTDSKRLQFLTELFKAANAEAPVLSGSDLKGSNFLKLLLEYRRVSVLPEISEALSAIFLSSLSDQRVGQASEACTQ